MIRQSLLFLFLSAGAVHSAFAGPVEVQSIQIVPAETTLGKQPKITGSIAATKDLARGKTLDITVIAVVVRPDHVVKSWSWKKVSMKAGEIRSFSIPKKYDVQLAGTYKVDFNVYSSGMKPLHSISRSFIVVDPSLPKETPATLKDERSPAGSVTGQTASRSVENRHVGAGIYANTLNGAGGAMILLWPFKYVGLQGSYTTGSFTITEGRVLARLPLSSGINPYLGAGYLIVNTERSVELINVREKFQDKGVSGVIGVEIPLSRRLSGYIEVCGASIDLKKEIRTGTVTGTASVKYAPVSIGIGIAYFLF